MSKKATLILVSGHAGAGKTSLAKQIADRFKLPLHSVDAVKEVLWDTLGHDFDSDFFDKIGKTAFELAYHYIHESLSKGVSLVVEAHFDPERNNDRLNKLKEDYDVKLVQIYCACEKATLQNRFKQRMSRGSYHAGHRHAINLFGEEKVLDGLGIKNKRLDINGATYDLDTTKVDKIDYERLFKFIASNLAGCQIR